MFILLSSAAFVGFVHSLAPGHWLPIVLMARARRWHLSKALLGALVTSSGHILVSSALAGATVLIGVQFMDGKQEELERYSGLGLLIFGLIYAAYSYKTHSHCHEHHHEAGEDEPHSHHGPKPRRREKAPFLFLFMVGFSPCVASLPVILAAGVRSWYAMVGTVIAFAMGVITALSGSTLLAHRGFMKLDHPLLEHYGDVITGVGLAVMGGVLFFIGWG